MIMLKLNLVPQMIHLLLLLLFPFGHWSLHWYLSLSNSEQTSLLIQSNYLLVIY